MNYFNIKPSKAKFLIHKTKVLLIESYKKEIKQNENDFLVKEVLSEKVIDSFDNLDGHPVYLLKKSGIDTNHALIDIEKRYGLILKSLGLKDANAKTEQYVYTYKKINSLEEYTGQKYSAKRLGFVEKPISKKDMLGNYFEIRVSDLNEPLSSFTGNENILNFWQTYPQMVAILVALPLPSLGSNGQNNSAL